MSEIFYEEQIDKLRAWNESLQTEKAMLWKAEEDKAEQEISKIFNDKNFDSGNNLASEDFDTIFHLMRNFSNNRALSNLLYRENGLEQFNEKLRALLFGNETDFVNRVNEFFKLKGIGQQTLSQFLVAKDPSKFPLITWQTTEALNLGPQQEEKAYELAMRHFNIDDPTKYLDRTIDYLTNFIIFEEIKNLLGTEKYTSVNNLIWFGKKSANPEMPEEILENYSSISLEKDLKEYLAKNPHLIEKGLQLTEKEFNTKEVGKIDLLCKDQKGKQVIIELKKGRSSDEVVGQTLRYLGWIKKNKSENARAIIITNEPDNRLDYAIMPVENQISLKYYKVKFEINDKHTNQTTQEK